MKYISSNTKRIYELDGADKKRTTCPECSDNRRKKMEACLWWDKDTNRGYCHHCETTLFPYIESARVEYNIPEWKNKTELTDKAVKYFEGRGISQGTLIEMKVYSDKEYMPQFQKEVDVICFPYFVAEKLVNIKYRGPEKSFKLFQGAELVFWNLDKITDEVVIVEGEIDLLSFIEVGIKNVISVPNGANKNLEYIDTCHERFEKVTKIYLATDNDKKGIELRDELARRFGFQKCYIVNFRECKDANEYLTKYSGFDLKGELINAKPYPVKGIVKVGDIYGDIRQLFDNGIQRGLTISSDLDKYITWEGRRLAIVTGIPGHGKSEFVDFLIARLNILYGWKVALFTPENYPLKFHYAKLFEKFIGRQFNKQKITDEDFNIGYEYIRDNFFYIMDEEDYSIDMILDSAKSLIQGRGIKVLVIDPYNKLEYQAARAETETQYISRFLDKLQMFARFNDVLVILVAHPKKMQKQGKQYDVPTLYDISGSAHFYNKADYGISIYRISNETNTGYENEVQIHIQKVKFKHLGECGMVEMKYNYNNGRFENYSKTVDSWDNANWLVNAPNQFIIEDFQTTNEVPF